MLSLLHRPPLGLVPLLTTLLLACLIGPSARGMTLDEALRRVLAQHPAIAARQHAADAVSEDLEGVKWQRFPTFTAESSQRVARSSDAGDAGHGSTLRLEQPLWSGGRITADIDAAQRRLAVAQLAVQETEQDLLGRTVTAYCEQWRWRQRLETARHNTQEHERLYQMIRRRADQEVSSEIDAALAKARWQQAQAEEASFEASLAAASSTLTQLLGEPAPPDNALPQAQAAELPLLEQAQTQAQDAAPALQRTRMEAEQARAEASSREAALYPTVALRVEHLNGNGLDKATDRALLVMQMQPGAGLSAFNARTAAARRLLAAEDGVDVARRELSDRVGNQWAEARSLQQQAPGLQAYAQAMREVMASYLRQYTVGRKSWLEVLNAQRDVATSQYASDDARAALTAARHRLDILIGRLQRDSLLHTP
jgi:adhesin transport system outer membrane protein